MYDIMYGIGFLLIILICLPDIIAGLRRKFGKPKDKPRPSAAKPTADD